MEKGGVEPAHLAGRLRSVCHEAAGHRKRAVVVVEAALATFGIWRVPNGPRGATRCRQVPTSRPCVCAAVGCVSPM